MTNPLSLQPLPLDQLPTSANDPRYEPLLKSLLASASTLIASLPSKSASWRPRKVYNTPDHPTATYSSPSPPGPASLPSGISWHARVSSHAGARYEDFRDGLLVDHTVHEQEYVHSCVEAERLQVIKEGVLEGELRRGDIHLQRALIVPSFQSGVQRVSNSYPQGAFRRVPLSARTS